MRIVAGTARGRRIVTPAGSETRPTTDRVREAIFNSLHSHGLVSGATVVDLFAGSGALGLEALSRGAAHAIFVEHARPALAAIRANLASLGFAERATVVVGDAVRVATTVGRVDVALLDPPYAFDGWPGLLADLDAVAVVVESDRAIELPADLRILKQASYGGTVVTVAVGEGSTGQE